MAAIFWLRDFRHDVMSPAIIKCRGKLMISAIHVNRTQKTSTVLIALTDGRAINLHFAQFLTLQPIILSPRYLTEVSKCKVPTQTRINRSITTYDEEVGNSEVSLGERSSAVVRYSTKWAADLHRQANRSLFPQMFCIWLWVPRRARSRHDREEHFRGPLSVPCVCIRTRTSVCACVPESERRHEM